VAKQKPEHIIAEAAEKITAALDTNLSALVLYGSHARGEAHARSDINLFVLVRNNSPEELIGLLQVVPALGKKNVAPLVLFGEDGFRASQDTFALEFLDMAASRRVLAGQDPFENFTPHWNGLRTEIEREFRIRSMQLLRMWFLSAQKPAALKGLIRGSLSSFLSLLRGIVALEKKQVLSIPHEELLGEITGERGLTPELWKRFWQVAREEVKLNADDLRKLFHDYLSEIRKLTVYIDTFAM
jgi:predicted nucleotidyltransferase